MKSLVLTIERFCQSNGTSLIGAITDWQFWRYFFWTRHAVGKVRWYLVKNIHLSSLKATPPHLSKFLLCCLIFFWVKLSNFSYVKKKCLLTVDLLYFWHLHFFFFLARLIFKLIKPFHTLCHMQPISLISCWFLASLAWIIGSCNHCMVVPHYSICVFFLMPCSLQQTWPSQNVCFLYILSAIYCFLIRDI